MSSPVELTLLVPDVRRLRPRGEALAADAGARQAVPGVPTEDTAESARTAGPEPELVELYDSGPLSGHTDGMRVQANFVTSVDGAYTGADGRSGSISSPADMRVFSVLRSLADAVVVGAQTTRAEGYTRLSEKRAYQAERRARGQQPAPLLVIVSGSGRIDFDQLGQKGTSDVVVHTATADPDRLAALREFCGEANVVTHEAISSEAISPEAVLADLRSRGARRILCEGGPTLLGEWVAAGVVDELCLTVSPVLAGASTPQPGATGDPASAPGVHLGILGSTPLSAPVSVTPLSLLTDYRTYIHRLAVAPEQEEP